MSQETPLRRVLDSQGRRLEWVAREVDVHPHTIGRWASGKDPIPPGRIPQLASLLGVDEAEIVERVA